MAHRPSTTTAPHQNPTWAEKVDLFGLRVSLTNYVELVHQITSAAKKRHKAVVTCHAVHAIIETTRHTELLRNANRFQVVAPDGQPVRWALNLMYGARLPDRVYGPELTLKICEAAATANLPVYFYGGTQTVVEKLARNLKEKFPGLEIAGLESPPFRELTNQEATDTVERINQSGARIVFIGLGFPKQDVFAAEHQDKLQAVQVCVGAAFDFHAGEKPMAPVWMQNAGLEWCFRLFQEPARLWKRYLVTNSIFLLRFFTQVIPVALSNWLRGPVVGKSS